MLFGLVLGCLGLVFGGSGSDFGSPNCHIFGIQDGRAISTARTFTFYRRETERVTTSSLFEQS